MNRIIMGSVACFLALACLAPAFSDARNEAISPIPVYPGGSVQLQFMITGKLILPAIEKGLNAAKNAVGRKGPVAPAAGDQAKTPDDNTTPSPGTISTALDDSSVKALMGALSGLKQLDLIYYQVPASAGGQHVMDFYKTVIGAGVRWSKIFGFDSPGNSVGVYSKANNQGLLAIYAGGENVGVARILGHIDVDTLSAWGKRMKGIVGTSGFPMPGTIPPTTPSK